MCDFCGVEEQTFTHLFLECPIVKRIWLKWCTHFDYQVNNVTIERILLNDFVTRTDNVKNLCGLIMKQFIYRCKCDGSMPTFEGVMQIIYSIKQAELYNARKLGDKAIRKCSSKWTHVQ